MTSILMQLETIMPDSLFFLELSAALREHLLDQPWLEKEELDINKFSLEQFQELL